MRNLPIHKITMAVDFHDGLPQCLYNALNFAEALGAGLRLVHVVDPWDLRWIEKFPSPSQMESQTLMKEAGKDAAKSMLQLMVDAIDTSVVVETAVLEGDVIQSIRDDLKQHHCDFVITGVSKNPLGEISGLSKALDFARDISLPVLILDRDSYIPRPEEGLKITVADDLGVSGFAALNFAEQFASAYPQSSLTHAFINQNFAEMGKSDKDAVLAQLRDRGQGILHMKDQQNINYQTFTCYGYPEIELHKLANATMSDMMIFGHHQVLHKRSHRLGEITHKKMLEQHRAVLLVPEMHSLEA